jgi:CHAT domain-containing protein
LARYLSDSHEVRDIYDANGQEIFEALFDGCYRFIHLAGHGMVKGKGGNFTGMVLGPKIFLTSAQVSKMRRVPEFVFLNCCHLGSMAEDAEPRWGELAASLATQFIEMGCKAVIAAGWAVDDRAANTFACVIYENMLKEARFSLAVQQARCETYRLHPSSNIWGAFQAYGDERHRFPGIDRDDPDFADEYVHPDHLIADLDLLTACLQCAPSESRQNL